MKGVFLSATWLAINHKRLLPAATPGGFYLHGKLGVSPTVPHNENTHTGTRTPTQHITSVQKCTLLLSLAYWPPHLIFQAFKEKNHFPLECYQTLIHPHFSGFSKWMGWENNIYWDIVPLLFPMNWKENKEDCMRLNELV